MSLSQRFFSEAFRDMQRSMAAFDQAFYNTARRSVLGSPGSLLNQNLFGGNLLRYPAADMTETENTYELSTDLPGYEKKDIKIELADNRTLVLSGSMNEQKEITSSSSDAPAIAEGITEEKADTSQSPTETVVEDKLEKIVDGNQEALAKNETKEIAAPQYWVKERVSGSFSRSFAFPKSINPKAIKASFENGVLKITVPKAVENQSKKIHIE